MKDITKLFDKNEFCLNVKCRLFLGHFLILIFSVSYWIFHLIKYLFTLTELKGYCYAYMMNLVLFLCFFSFIFISWRLITLQYCSGFCHTLTWISHGVTCIPHPNHLSHLPPHKFLCFFKQEFFKNPILKEKFPIRVSQQRK